MFSAQQTSVQANLLNGDKHLATFATATLIKREKKTHSQENGAGGGGTALKGPEMNVPGRGELCSSR